jgi:hypothetical protein
MCSYKYSVDNVLRLGVIALLVKSSAQKVQLARSNNDRHILIFVIIALLQIAKLPPKKNILLTHLNTFKFLHNPNP